MNKFAFAADQHADGGAGQVQQQLQHKDLHPGTRSCLQARRTQVGSWVNPITTSTRGPTSRNPALSADTPDRYKAS
jgi:hypothetical protein